MDQPLSPLVALPCRGSLLHHDCAPTERPEARFAARCALFELTSPTGTPFMKIVLWIIFIIFLIGLAVVLGLGKLIF
ncbi:hypothetical protein [Variovorax arabinosiphilus]|uniref:hypothetical protein n=1 Tax=Variovorax arabinosiphilus TaxID=3053498 RepID=UPI00257504DF|nr:MULTISPECIES: hypothetical protein [unclassified Variovorax]MDM0118453.1 hypothetical protein [Variovorax sp. J2L1-78]MDM0128878.1 hypothetical protein [Variovorax sp. J2L1-63]MDM0233336.1 hypothetical protein [Variovorax sp. J2R1-6]